MIEIPISFGELLDRITILEIKMARIDAPDKRRNVNHQLALLEEIRALRLPREPRIDALQAQLREVNETLWEIEDALRERERSASFDAAFIELARSVYVTNDRRAALKRAIDEALGGELLEEKSYAPY